MLLRDIDWRVEHEEHLRIAGPNGAGKTTLLRIASAQLIPSTGQATLLGGRLGATSLPSLRRRIGARGGARPRRVGSCCSRCSRTSSARDPR